MQRIHDLTSAQLLALTTEQIERYIDVECLHEGIALLPAEAPVEPDAKKPEPDQTVYVVGHFEFETIEDATKIVAAIAETKQVNLRYNNINGETFYVVDDPYSHDRPTITTKKGFSKHAWVDAQRQAKEYTEATRTYKELKKDYDAAVKGRQKAIDEVWAIVHEARDAAERRERLIREFNRYLSLADGDRKTAWKFFLAAYPHAEEVEGLHLQLVEFYEPVQQEDNHAEQPATGE